MGEPSELKVVLLGSPGVGKTSLIMRLSYAQFEQDYDPTLSDWYEKIVTVDGKTVKIIFIEDPFHEEPAVKARRFQTSDGFLLLYSITDNQSLEAVLEDLGQIDRARDEDDNYACVLVGNKLDLETDRQVPVRLDATSTTSKQPYYEISAKEDKNTMEPLLHLVRLMLARLPKVSNSTKRSPNGAQKCAIQ